MALLVPVRNPRLPWVRICLLGCEGMVSISWVKRKELRQREQPVQGLPVWPEVTVAGAAGQRLICPPQLHLAPCRQIKDVCLYPKCKGKQMKRFGKDVKI